ncbi:glycosyltransferase [uncultured Enterovirga sp.]|uniref:glycosyltransferase family 2 protein n=1 Tax=uncultured Enterovirga sp. TaxID=2026352 RepID=UPI0035CB9621
MLFPVILPRTVGLKRTGPFRWRAIDDDPQFKFLLGWWRPRHLIFVLDGLDAQVDPALYLDIGEGFEEHVSASFRSAGRFVCRIDLHQMPEVRRVRLDPASRPASIGLVAWAAASSIAANWLMKRLSRSRVPTGPTRVQTVRESAIATVDFGSGLEQRRYPKTEDHYAELLAIRPDWAAAARPGANPVISFLIPTFDTRPRFLDDLLRSFRAQPDGLAELVFADDGSSSAETHAWLAAHADEPGVTMVPGGTNQGIASATNRALAAATAPWVALLDHDDALTEGAVGLLVGTLERYPDTLLLYTDEAVSGIDLRVRDYLLKPAYDPVLLSGVNYINHLSLYRRDRLSEIGGLRDGYQGSQDYDLLLRYLDGIDPARVRHLPYPAYVWRRHETSFSSEHEGVAVASARRALAERYSRDGVSPSVEPALSPSLHRIRFDRGRTAWPRVSVIIPSRNAFALIRQVLEGLTGRTDYPRLEIIVVDNGSDDPEVAELYERHRRETPDFRADIVVEPFNFSRSVNRGLSHATGEYVLLLNNDIEIVEPGWLKEMVSCFAYPGTGIVGARLLYPDRTIQHAGVIVGAGGLAGHWYERKPEHFRGPLGRLTVRQTMTAVTGAAMLVSRRCFDAVGAFDEELFAIAYNDIDFCLRAREHGYRVVWTPFATLIHHESASRGSDVLPETIERFRREQHNLRTRHGTQSFADPATNPWYTRDRSVPLLRGLDELPESR